MKEVIEMTRILLAMNPDTYMEAKYISMAVSREHPGMDDFITALFDFTDRRRPMLIGMKEAGNS